MYRKDIFVLLSFLRISVSSQRATRWAPFPAEIRGQLWASSATMEDLFKTLVIVKDATWLRTHNAAQ
jgi:hypothetical protein